MSVYKDEMLKQSSLVIIIIIIIIINSIYIALFSQSKHFK
jgi:hypothetical protein